MVDRLFGDADRGGTGQIAAGDVAEWMAHNFSVGGVTVPGQSDERGEIAAVRARLDQMLAGRARA